MNIYEYFNSPDIAAHCQKIGHKFNPLEMAVIVAGSRKTLKEKHTAYRQIIEEYPDMPICGNASFEPRESLRTYLKDALRQERESLESFYTAQPGSVYQISCGNSGLHNCFSTPQKAVEHFICELNEWLDKYIKKNDNIQIRRIRIDETGDDASDYVDIDIAGEPIYYCIDSKTPNDLGNMIFIHLPVPFERGDIVEFSDGKPLVLEHHPHYWDTKRFTRFKYEDFVSGKIGDGWDMQVGYYYIGDDGCLEWEHGPYGCMRFYAGEETRQVEFLKCLGKYIKRQGEGQTDGLNWLVNAYGKFKARADGERHRELMTCSLLNYE